MKFLKKLWNTDLFGRIYICINLIILLATIIVVTIIVITKYKNAYELEKVNTTEQNKIVDDVVNDISVNENIGSGAKNIVSEENTEQNNEETTPVSETISSAEETSVTIPSQEIAKQEVVETVQETPKVEEVKKEETKEIQTQSNVKPEETVKEKVTEEKPIENTNENKQEDKQEKVEETKPTEEYKINTEMINTMKSVIENNPSETMKTYGYEVKVDSSILELTDQFTYTEQRLKDKITYKFGTIRIYAQDYYYNGHFVSTQCFII